MRVAWREFRYWRMGVMHALAGGLWLHRFVLRGDRWAHLVSADRRALLEAGRQLTLREEWLQYRPLRDPTTGERVAAWHWDLKGDRLERALDLAEHRLPRR
ncbi:MAG TPA: hypothetical protein VGA22_13135 [Gemmatimonadales bacterium]